MNFVSDMAREITGLRQTALPIEVKVGSLSGFFHAMSSQLDRFPKRKEAVKSGTFLGLDVVEDNKLPAKTAVILSSGEIVNIFTFD